MPRPNPSRNRPETIKAIRENGNFEISNGTLIRLIVIAGLAYCIFSGNISVSLNLDNDQQAVEYASLGQAKTVSQGVFSSIFGGTAKKQKAVKKSAVALPKSALNNVTFAIDPGFAVRFGLDESIRLDKQAKCTAYVQRYAPVAVAEMRKFGIPASITLAQGLLESNAGESVLTKKSNNHFGIKCFSRRCAKGHCINMTDDSHKDFFRKFSNSWGSFRAHSEFIKNSDRYNTLFKLPGKDYKNWAIGLSKAGYATDKFYGQKLVAIIENLELQRFD